MDAEIKSVLDSLKEGIGGFQAAVTALKDSQSQMQRQLDALDIKAQGRHVAFDGAGQGRISTKSLVDKIGENLDVLQKSGRLILQLDGSLLPARELKSVLTTSGVVTPQDLGVIEAGGRPDYVLRNVFRSIPTTASSVFRVRENVYTNNASPQVEGEAKQESTITLVAGTIPVQTFAHYVNVSRQALDDMPGLAAYLDTALVWGLEAKVEAEILAGDGTGVHLEGIIPAAAAFDTGYLLNSDGWEFADILSAAAVQLRLAGYRCDTFVLNASDWRRIETSKDAMGRYIVGNPRSSLSQVLWNRAVIDSPAMPAGTFLALDSRRFHIRQRMATTIDISYENGTNFQSNLVTIRAEERLAFIIGRTDAAVYGSLTTSPA